VPSVLTKMFQTTTVCLAQERKKKKITVRRVGLLTPRKSASMKTLIQLGQTLLPNTLPQDILCRKEVDRLTMSESQKKMSTMAMTVMNMTRIIRSCLLTSYQNQLPQGQPLKVLRRSPSRTEIALALPQVEIRYFNIPVLSNLLLHLQHPSLLQGQKPPSLRSR